MLEDIGSRDARLVDSVRQSRAALVQLASGGDTHDAIFVQGTSLPGSISTILTVWSWICMSIHGRGTLPSPVLA